MDYFKVKKVKLGGTVKPFKIGIIGNINKAKGLSKLISLANYLYQTGKDHQLLVIGNVSKPNKLPANMDTTGSYDSQQLANIIQKKKLDVFFMPSIWPETFSYVTEELIRLHVPIIAYDLGAQGEKVRGYNKGKLIPIDASNKEIIDAIYYMIDTYR